MYIHHLIYKELRRPSDHPRWCQVTSCPWPASKTTQWPGPAQPVPLERIGAPLLMYGPVTCENFPSQPAEPSKPKSISLTNIPPKFNMVGKQLSYWEGNFLVTMLNFGRVIQLTFSKMDNWSFPIWTDISWLSSLVGPSNSGEKNRVCWRLRNPSKFVFFKLEESFQQTGWVRYNMKILYIGIYVNG